MCLRKVVFYDLPRELVLVSNEGSWRPKYDRRYHKKEFPQNKDLIMPVYLHPHLFKKIFVLLSLLAAMRP